MKGISFIILTWNSERYILNCLNSIFNLGNTCSEVIIIDNGSKDNTVDLLKRGYPNIQVIQLKSNYGTSYSRNIGLKISNRNNSYICILDSDTVVNEKAINNMVDCLEMNSLNMVSVPQMCNLKGEYQYSYKKFPTIFIKLFKAVPINQLNILGNKMENYNFSFEKKVYEIDYGISACWMMRREVLNLAGYLDENIFYSPEDVDYCATVWKNGGKVILATDSMIIHDTQRISKKKLVSRHNISHIFGLVYYFWKHKYLFSADKLRKTSKNI